MSPPHWTPANGNATASFNQVCTVRTELLENNPAIWREMEVPTSVTLKVLREIVQAVIGSLVCHLWKSKMNGRTYDLPKDKDRGTEPRTGACWVRLRDVLSPGSTHLPFWTLLVVVAMVSMPAAAQVTGSSGIAAADAGKCLDPSKIVDPTGAISRNLADLASPRLCVMRYGFKENGLDWQLLVVRQTSHPATVLWVVPHDNEQAAFDNAVRGVRLYGGTIVAVKTGGERFNHGQDPNRNFDLGTGPLCPEQHSRSPLYTAEILRWRGETTPIVGLHTNDKGFKGDGQGGKGTISIRLHSRNLRPFVAPHAEGASPDDTMIYVASKLAPDGDADLRRRVDGLNSRRVNVAYEIVSRASNDCSLSNFSVLAGVAQYYNVEAVHGDVAGHLAVAGILMSEIGIAVLDK